MKSISLSAISLRKREGEKFVFTTKMLGEPRRILFAHIRRRCGRNILNCSGVQIPKDVGPGCCVLRPTGTYVLPLILPNNLPAQHLSCSPTPSRVLRKIALPMLICISLWSLYAHSLSAPEAKFFTLLRHNPFLVYVLRIQLSGAYAKDVRLVGLLDLEFS